MKSLEKIEYHDLASIHLFPYLALYNAEIDPMHKHNTKFSMCLCGFFSHFINEPNERIILLEASPRSGKTNFILNVVIPFIAGNNPNKRMIIITANKQTRKNVIRSGLERIFKSDFFKKTFNCYGKLMANEYNITLPNGFNIFMTTTLSDPPIGSGYHFQVAIDFINAAWVSSRATMTSAMTNWNNFSTRREKWEDETRSLGTKLIIDNQRLDFYDLSHKITSESDKNNQSYTRITLPYQFKEDTNILLPQGYTIPFKKGEFLVDRFNDNEKKVILSTTSRDLFEIQYQQNPSAEKNKIFYRNYFKYYTQQDLDNLYFQQIFITTDFAFTQKEESDFTVLCCWAECDGNLLLLDMLRGKYKGSQLNAMLQNFYKKWKNGFSNEHGSYFCSSIVIEQSGQQNIVMLDNIQNGFILEDGSKFYFDCAIIGLPRKGINKYTRVMRGLPFVQAGKVFLPAADVKIEGVNNVVDDIVEPFLLEHEQFNDNENIQRKLHDDIVDNCMDAIYLVNRGQYSFKTDILSA